MAEVELQDIRPKKQESKEEVPDTARITELRQTLNSVDGKYLFDRVVEIQKNRRNLLCGELNDIRRAVKLEELWGIPDEDKINNLIPDVKQRWEDRVNYESFFNFFSENRPGLIKVAISWMKWDLFVMFILAAGTRAFPILAPLVLNQFVLHIERYSPTSLNPIDTTDSAEVGRGYLYPLAFFGIALLVSLMNVVLFHWLFRRYFQLRACFADLVFTKSLTLSAAEKNETESGKVLNMMATDADTLSVFMVQLNDAFLVPVQVVVTLSFIYQVIGKAMWTSLIVLVSFMPVMLILFSAFFYVYLRMKTIQDKRIKIINEVIQGIRIVKYYGWESTFKSRISPIRDEELSSVYSMNFISIMFLLIFLLLPVGMTYFSLMIYDKNNPATPLTSGQMFMTLGLFEALKMPLFSLPQGLASYAQAKVASGRIRDYLLLADVNTESIRPAKDPEFPLGISNGSFVWEHFETPLYSIHPVEKRQELIDKHTQEEKDIKTELEEKSKRYNELEAKKKDLEAFSKKLPQAEEQEMANEKKIVDEVEQRLQATRKILRSKAPILQDLTCQFKKGSLTAVVGPVGSGKSSILSALLNEMDCIKGTIYRPNKISYVSQKAWIQNKTVRDNILFSQPMNNERYQDAVRVCGLTSDLDILPSHDLTEIGEHGINLSGGQKQRISIARAVYSDSATMFFDDPLSAVDSNVGKYIFEEAILKFCAGKTRVLVTNQLHYVQRCDDVIVLENGTVTEAGNVSDLLKNENSKISQLMKNYTLSLQDKGEKKTPEKELTYGNEFEHKQATDTNKKIEGETEDKTTEEEELYTGAVSAAAYTQYIGSLSSFSFWILFPLSAIISQGSIIVSTFVLAFPTTDDLPAFLAIITQDNYMRTYGILAGISALSFVVHGLVWASAAVRASSFFHKNILERIMKATTQFFDETPSGRIVNRFSGDMYKVDMEVPTNIDSVVTVGMFVLMNLIGVAIVIPFFAIPLALAFAMGVYVYLKYRVAAVQMGRLLGIAKSPIFHTFSESFNGTDTIRAFQMEDETTKTFRSAMDGFTNASFTHQIVIRWASVRMGMVNALLAFLAPLLVLLNANTFSTKLGLVGAAVAFTLGVGEMLTYLFMILVEVENAMNGVERLTHYSTEVPIEPEFRLDTDPKQEIWPSEGKIEFNKATFKYPRGVEPAMKELSTVVQPKEKIGVVGRTGSGKSTMMLSLFRLYGNLQSGSIVIDGVDIQNIGLHTLRQSLALVPQDPVVFSGTIRDNLDPFRLATDEEIWEVLKKIELEDLVKQYEKQLSEPVAEFGGNLSAGQRQLLCIGRALLKKPKILLLDEATSSVDSKTDGKIQEVIRKAFVDCTVVTIAHRLNTIMDSDRVLFMEKGVLMENGPPAELLKIQNGRFRTMYEAMTRGESDVEK